MWWERANSAAEQWETVVAAVIEIRAGSREQARVGAAGLAHAPSPSKTKPHSRSTRIRRLGWGRTISTRRLHLLTELRRWRRSRSWRGRWRIWRRRSWRRRVRSWSIRRARTSLLRLRAALATPPAPRLLSEFLHALPLLRTDHNDGLRHEDIVFNRAPREDVIARLYFGHRDR